MYLSDKVGGIARGARLAAAMGAYFASLERGSVYGVEACRVGVGYPGRRGVREVRRLALFIYFHVGSITSGADVKSSIAVFVMLSGGLWALGCNIGASF